MIELLLINSLLIIGIHANSGYSEDKPQAFYWLHKIKAPWWVKKPLIECVSCMASVHSMYVYWPWVVWCGQMGLKALLVYPIYVVALSGLNYLLNRITTMNNIDETTFRKALRDEFNNI